MRAIILIVCVLLVAACDSATAPPQCFQVGDTVGWVTVKSKVTGDTLVREPLTVTTPFCL